MNKQLAAAVMLLAGWGALLSSIRAIAADESSAPDSSPEELQRIVDLEKEIFNSKLTPEEVDRELATLTKPDQQTVVFERLSTKAQGYQDRIVEAARKF